MSQSKMKQPLEFSDCELGVLISRIEVSARLPDHPETHKLLNKILKKLKNAAKPRGIDRRAADMLERMKAYIEENGPCHVAEMERDMRLCPMQLSNVIRRWGLPKGYRKRLVDFTQYSIVAGRNINRRVHLIERVK